MNSNTLTLAIPDQELGLALADELRGELEAGTAFEVQPSRWVVAPGGAGFIERLSGEMSQELMGVAIHSRIIRALWGEERIPLCTSNDGRVGFGEPGGQCAVCRFNVFGTGKGGRGKACKEMRRLVIVVEGETFPALLHLPPTSIRPWDAYASGLLRKRLAYFAVKTRFTIRRERNVDGAEYGIVEPQEVETLDANTLRVVIELRKQYEALLGEPADVEDYIANGAQDHDDAPF